MASNNESEMSGVKVKIEIDVAEEPKQQQSLRRRWAVAFHQSESNSKPITPSETGNPSATMVKCELDTQTDRCQDVKDEPLDYRVTGDVFHRCQSSGEREVHIKQEPDSPEVSPSPWSLWNGGSSEYCNQTSWNDRPTVIRHTDNVTAKVNDFVIKSEPDLSDSNSSEPTEWVTDVVTTESGGVMRVSARRDEETGRPAKQKRDRPGKKRPQAESGAVYSTVQPTSDSPSTSRALAAQHVCRHCSATFVLFSSLKLHMISTHDEKVESALLVPSAAHSSDAGDYSNMDTEQVGDHGNVETLERAEDGAVDSDAEGDGGKKKAKHVCGVCSKVCKRATNLKSHMLTHTDYKPFACDMCSKSFTTAGNLKVHKRKHTGLKPFVCDICSKAFAAASTLNRHRWTHSGHKQFECDVCGKTFTQSFTLRRHRLVHTGLKPFVCDVCSKTFFTCTGLAKHKLLHEDKQLVCDVCAKPFTQAWRLKAHMLTHTGEKPFVCDVCSKKFTDSCSLKRHRRTHTGERPYRCTHCEADFSQSGSLRCHIRAIHAGDKPYVCDVCGSAFSRIGTLKKHKEIHTEEKPYRCSHCEADFTHFDNLQLHFRLTHSDD